MRLLTTLPQATPLRVDPDRRKQLGDDLRIAIEDALSARLALESEWRNDLRMYEAIPKLERRDTPIENAPNIEVPLGAIACDSIYAQAVDLIYNVSPVLTVRPTRRNWTDTAKVFQTWVNWLSNNEIESRAAVDHALLDDIQLGSGFFYIPYTIKQKRTRIHEVLWQGPRMFAVAPEDLLVPGGAYPDLQRLPWVAQRLWMRRSELKEYEARERWAIGEAMPCGAVDWMRQRRESLAKTPAPAYAAADLYEIWRIYCYYDLNNDGFDEDLLVIWDRTSGSVLRVRYNPNDCRPYESMVYQIRPHCFYGLGVLEMLRPFQEEATELHNHRTLNLMLANARVWGAKTGVMTATSKIWPSKVIPLADPKNDLVSLQMADVYASAFQAELITTALAERRVGVHNLDQRGGPPVGTRTPGITTLSILQQATKRFAPAFDGMRLAVARAHRQAIYRIQERLLAGGMDEVNAQASIYAVMGQVDGERIVTVLKDQHFDESVSIELTASSGSINRESDRQNAILLANLMTQYYERLIQLGMVAANPQMPPAMQKLAANIAQKAGELADRTIRTFDQVRDPEALIVHLGEVLNAVGPTAQTGLSGLGQLLGQLTGGAGPGGPGGGGPPLALGAGPGPGSPGEEVGAAGVA